MARTHAEALAAWEKATEEAKDKAPRDDYALQAAEFRETWDLLWRDHFGKFEDITKIPSMLFTDNPPPTYTAFVYHTL
ncbi:hypothetical protein PR202_ga15617 [Eleusine coracana subsp. coracana]|uniref:Uncharacterized protein n=1 Tax=Eleusine coracana subsp. coracana TaxID=191504 RepID=A0AAV5CKJ2_ELECO|nr:hypothetical protein PR202_ga15617 [Eleusine coracana subsp. coracana]